MLISTSVYVIYLLNCHYVDSVLSYLGIECYRSVFDDYIGLLVFFFQFILLIVGLGFYKMRKSLFKLVLVIIIAITPAALWLHPYARLNTLTAKAYLLREPSLEEEKQIFYVFDTRLFINCSLTGSCSVIFPRNEQNTKMLKEFTKIGLMK